MVRKSILKIIGNTGASALAAQISTVTGESIQNRVQVGNQSPRRSQKDAENGSVNLLKPPLHSRRKSTRNKSKVINTELKR